MNVLSKRNIILPGPNGEKFQMKKGYEGPVPEWAEKSEYLKALAKDRKVSILDKGGKVKPQFFGVRETAANIGRERGDYTAEMFQEDFPQFFDEAMRPLLPCQMFREFIAQANASIQPDKWLDGWRYACGLYTAHQAALYLRTYRESSATPAEAAATGALVGVVKSAALGDSSVSYDTDALTKATADWGDLNATQYGQLLATRARLVGMGGTYVI